MRYSSNSKRCNGITASKNHWGFSQNITCWKALDKSDSSCTVPFVRLQVKVYSGRSGCWFVRTDPQTRHRWLNTLMNLYLLTTLLQYRRGGIQQRCRTMVCTCVICRRTHHWQNPGLLTESSNLLSMESVHLRQLCALDASSQSCLPLFGRMYCLRKFCALDVSSLVGIYCYR